MNTKKNQNKTKNQLNKSQKVLIICTWSFNDLSFLEDIYLFVEVFLCKMKISLMLFPCAYY